MPKDLYLFVVWIWAKYVMANSQKTLSSLVVFSNSGQPGDWLLDVQVVERSLRVPLRPLTCPSRGYARLSELELLREPRNACF